MSNVRYDKKFTDEITRVIRNYNSKIYRLNKKGIKVPNVNRITLTEIKKTLHSRSEIRDKLNDLKEFSKRGSENKVPGTNLTNYQKAIIKRYRSKLNRRINKELKFYEKEKPKSFGKEEIVTFSQIGEPSYINLINKKKILNRDLSLMTGGEIFKYIDLLLSNIQSLSLQRLMTWKSNFITMLEENSKIYGIPKTIVNKIINNLDKLNYKDFDNMIRRERALQQILYYYDFIKDIDNEDILNQIQDDVIELYKELSENIEELVKDYE